MLPDINEIIVLPDFSAASKEASLWGITSNKQVLTYQKHNMWTAYTSKIHQNQTQFSKCGGTLYTVIIKSHSLRSMPTASIQTSKVCNTTPAKQNCDS